MADVTGKDRKAAREAIHNWLEDVEDFKRQETWLAEAIAQAREEGRAEEREACAWTCERQRDCETDLGPTDCAARFAAAIRARGED